MQNDGPSFANSSNLTITKQDLTRSVHHNVGLSKAESAQMVDQIISLITDSLASGKNVKLSNFGTFQLIDKASRLGRNPKTNEVFPVAPRRAVTFKASSKLSKRVIEANAIRSKPMPEQLSSQQRDAFI